MSLDVETLLAPPDGTGELEVRWFDWLPDKDAVVAKLEAYRLAADTLLTAAGVTITDAAETAYVYWRAYNALAVEYGRRIGSTTINNEATVAVGSASTRPFTRSEEIWKLEWNAFVPDKATGSGVSASVTSHFMF